MAEEIAALIGADAVTVDQIERLVAATVDVRRRSAAGRTDALTMPRAPPVSWVVSFIPGIRGKPRSPGPARP
ncbi:hypothetical protein [Micromonospora sp. NPDC048898]|uniref:hypothetical protein n=1 Tax=Micromonospora sp. NPDC048898 TaxID=3364260 RepID=UPI00371AFEAE